MARTSGTPVPALASQEFKQTLGDRIGSRAYSRLVEISIPLKVHGADYRGLKEEDVAMLARRASEGVRRLGLSVSGKSDN